MKTHKIYARHSGVGHADRLSIPLIRRCIRTALRAEGVDVPCEVNVLVTGDDRIKEINKDFRGIDRPTDVLSFPAYTLIPGAFEYDPDMLDQETGTLPLGDIILSARRVNKQASTSRNSLDRETAFLTVHSVLHLLGYDHMDEADEKRQMRSRERRIMKELEYD